MSGPSWRCHDVRDMPWPLPQREASPDSALCLDLQSSQNLIGPYVNSATQLQSWCVRYGARRCAVGYTIISVPHPALISPYSFLAPPKTAATFLSSRERFA